MDNYPYKVLYMLLKCQYKKYIAFREEIVNICRIMWCRYCYSSKVAHLIKIIWIIWYFVCRSV